MKRATTLSLLLSTSILTVACSSNNSHQIESGDATAKQSPNPIVSTLASPQLEESDNEIGFELRSAFFTAALDALHEAPKDGRFGMTRLELPPAHGISVKATENSSKKKLKLAHSELANSYEYRVDLYGYPEPGTSQRRHTSFSGTKSSFSFARSPEGMEIAKKIDPAVEEVFLKKPQKMIVNLWTNPKSIIELRPVFASAPECYSCHKGVARGEPIGVLTLRIKSR